MATGVVSWSPTAATNASSDSTINWAEGQAPSTVNDSARALMASVAKYRDDISGAIVTGGTSTAYTVSSNQGFASFSALGNQIIAFTPHTTNGTSPTLNVDGLGAGYLRGTSGQNLPSGVLLQGTPYAAVYNSANGEFIIHGFFGNPYSIPIGASVDFWGTTAPNSSFALMYGQAISRTTYAALFTMFGTTYGTGDGSTTFNVPDCRGRVLAGKDDMGGSAASRLTSTYFGTSAAALGAVGGDEKSALSSTNQLPQFTPSGTISNGSITFPNTVIASAGNGQVGAVVTNSSGSGGANNMTSAFNASQNSSTFSGNAIGSGSPSSFRTVPPTIIANKLLRII